MSQSSSAFDPDEPVLTQFLGDCAAAGDPAVVLAAYVSAHPHLEKELRQLAAADDLMRRSRPEAEEAPPAPPSRLGEFRIVRRIAGGGMGEIYEAVQESLGRRVAVKTIRRGRLSPAAEARFLREQEVLASLHQTHIVPIHTAGRDGALQFFAMPFIEGVALHHVIRSLREDGPPPPSGKTPTLAVLVERASSASGRREPAGAEPIREQHPVPTGSRRPLALSAAYFRSVAAVLADAADALHYAHCHKAQILHRDVKPSNIMVDRAGQCWIIDFGLAAYLASGGRKPPDAAPAPEAPDPPEAVTASGLLGTPQYMAPEQWRKEALDARTDVWGLGATLYELLTLRRAFDGETVEAIRERVLSREPNPPGKCVRGVPGDLSAICQKALQKHADRRYATARDFAEDLRRWLRREPTSARPGLFHRVALWSLRNKGWAAAIALTLTASLGIVSAWLQVTQERENSANALAANDRDRARERDRDLLLRQLQLLRLTERRNGWSDKGWEMVRNARLLHDDELRNQAAALLVGIDAHIAVIDERRKADFTGQFNASAVAFDAEGKRLLIGGFDGRKDVPAIGARLWNGRADPLTVSQLLGAGPVAFGTDGAPLQLAPDGEDRLRLVLWDMGRRQQVQEFRLAAASDSGPLNKSNGPLMALTPNAVLVAASAALKDGSTRMAVWDAASGKVVAEIDAGARKVTALAVAPDGSCLAAGDEDGHVVVWPLPVGEPVALPSAGRAFINGLAFGRSPRRARRSAPDRRNWLLAAGDAGGTATVWDLGRDAAQTYCHGSSYDVYRVAFSPDGATLASAGRYYTRLWDVATGRLLVTLIYGDFMTGLAFSPDGRQLAVSTQDGFAKGGGAHVWALEPGRGMRSLRGLSSQVAKVCLSADGRIVAALSQDWQAAVWDRKTGALLRLLDAPHGSVADNAALTLSPDGRRLACAAGTEARLWDLDTGEVRSWSLPPGLQDCMAFDRSGAKLLLIRVEIADGVSVPFGGARPSVCPLRDLLGKEPTRPIRRIDDFDWQVFQVRMAAGGAWFAIKGLHGDGGVEQTFKLFDGATGAEVWSVPMQQTSPVDMMFDATGQRLAFVSESGGRPALLDLPSLRPHGSLAALADIGPEGKLRGQGSPTGSGYALYRSDGDVPAVILGIDLLATSLQSQFSADGALLAWGNADGSVTVCDLPEVQSRLAEVGLGW